MIILIILQNFCVKSHPKCSKIFLKILQRFSTQGRHFSPEWFSPGYFLNFPGPFLREVEHFGDEFRASFLGGAVTILHYFKFPDFYQISSKFSDFFPVFRKMSTLSTFPKLLSKWFSTTPPFSKPTKNFDNPEFEIPETRSPCAYRQAPPLKISRKKKGRNKAFKWN